MFKRICTWFVPCLVGVLLLTGCGGTASSSGVSSAATSNEVHMADHNFVQTSVTITKGNSLTLVDDASTVHIIQNGTWANSVAKPFKETGVPSVNVQLSGNDRQVIGPFSTAGTYQLYCIVHPGMNLTIVVQ